MMKLKIIVHIEPFSQRSGEQCGSNPVRNCLRNYASCVADACVCNNGRRGKGHFACYDPFDSRIEVKNDPEVRTATKESYQLSLPCRFLLSHFRTVFTAFHGSKCEVKVHAFNTKRRGKVFVHGLDIALRISTPISSPPVGDISYRVFGTASGGMYRFTEMGAFNFVPDGPWPRTGMTSAYMPMTDILPRYDMIDNMFTFTIDTCGFEIKFRPGDVILGKNQPQVPGVSIRVASGPVEWLSQDNVMGLQPGGTTVADIARGFNTVPDIAMLLRLFKTSTIQNHPDAPNACSVLPTVYGSCATDAKRVSATGQCLFILNESRFMRCYDSTENGQPITELFAQCVSALCVQADTSNVVDEVKKCQHLNIPAVDTFILSQRPIITP